MSTGTGNTEETSESKLLKEKEEEIHKKNIEIAAIHEAHRQIQKRIKGESNWNRRSIVRLDNEAQQYSNCVEEMSKQGQSVAKELQGHYAADDLPCHPYEVEFNSFKPKNTLQTCIQSFLGRRSRLYVKEMKIGSRTSIALLLHCDTLFLSRGTETNDSHTIAMSVFQI